MSRPKGSILSDLHKQRISIAHKGKKFTDEHKINLKKNHIRHTGKKHSEESKIKIRLAEKGKIRPQISGNKNPNWKGGISFELYGLEFTEKLKTEVRKRFGFQCVVCKKNGFVVHHIDYNKKNNCLSNLVCLCRSCHSATNHNRKFWIEQFNE